jgi:hypothetical protein
MALFRGLGALAFVLGVALLALDAARSLKIKSFEATSLERFWTNLGADGFFNLRFNLHNWLGDAAEKVLDLPAAFVAFGIGMTLLLAADGAMRDAAKKPLTF